MYSPGQLFLKSLPILVSLYATRYKLQDETESYPDQPADFNLPGAHTYDFIVVGGGTAGGIVASLLSDKHSVFVIEAGGNPPPIYAVPRAGPYIGQAPETNFVYASAPQENAGLQDDGRITVTAGKMLGGSSSHNEMIWEHGSLHDYDEWAKMTGDDSWKYENLRKYFRKIETYNGSFPKTDQHGLHGPVHVNEDPFIPGKDLWLQAGKELGYKIKDPNGPQAIGFAPMVYSKKNGRRASAYTAYLKPAIKRNGRRLKISRYSFASKIVFDEQKRAVGVEYKKDGFDHIVFASKEIILSAGVFVSPLILIQSGIGPMDQLRAGNIEKIMELPVGKNLIDHPKIDFGPIHLSDASLSWSITRNMTANDFDDFVRHGSGPLVTSSQSMDSHIVSETRLSSFRSGVNEVTESAERGVDNSKWSDLQITYTPMTDEKKSVYCIVGNSRPASKGRIRVNFKATNPDDFPIIDFKYYEQEIDINVTVDGIQFCLKLIEETEAFKSVKAHINPKPYRHCKTHKYRSRDYWKCYAKYHTRTGYHSVGTCRMGGGKNDPDAVVDSKLRVIGVERLRVVDASIMPEIVNANTAAATFMIGEKAADEILKKYGKSS